MAHQSLYRRYRPQRFSEVRGQATVVNALRTAVAEDRVGHAYLFSGPRGTGKTSTARILAKALNCEDLQGGEPCTVCASCVAMQEGRSFDLQELDAASKSKVDDIRLLIESVALGSPGRTKVYILDEVHMLSVGASNALLKTLEEPPDHVVFVLATTDPQKVLPTIRSRTQHFEFHLLPADELADHVRWVIEDAGLDVDASAIEQVLRAGGGSARDTLSYLDQAAAGGVGDDGDHAEALAEAVVAVDTAGALTAVAAATIAGRDPRILGEALLAHLRDIFLQRMGGPLAHLSGPAQVRVDEWAGRVTNPGVTRALEEVGEALLAMRQAPDPRIPLEVALVRITRGPSGVGGDAGGPALDDLIARVERLERAAASGTAGAVPAHAGAAPASAPPPAAPPSDQGDAVGGSASGEGVADARAAARAAAGRGKTARPAPAASSGAAPPPPPPGRPGLDRARAAPSEPSPEPEPPTVEPAPPRADEPVDTPIPDDGAVDTPTPDDGSDDEGVGGLAELWTTRVLPDELRGMAKALFKLGQVIGADDASLTVGLPNQAHLDRCAEKRDEAASALSRVAGRDVRLVLVVGGDAGDAGPPAGARPAPGPRRSPDDDPVEVIDPDELVDAPAQQITGVDRVTEAFPGAQIVDP